MWQIPIFAAEVAAGIADKVRATSSLSYAMVAQLATPPEHLTLSKRALSGVKNRVKATNLGQPDLHYLNTILVTTGVNKNDDAFDRIETWAARHSPEDKPFNYEHVGDDIIGHITGCHVIGEDQKSVADTTVVDELPDKFHIVTSAVLYKFWEDETLQERMDTILTEIAQGNWYVSMEALFKGFDYLLLNTAAQGADSMKVVARTSETAFLTKHLRAYGGDGTYQKYRVCRLLRNITFSGKGLVRKPANPESVIFSETETFNVSASAICGTAAQLGYENITSVLPQAKPKESKTMAAENTEVTVVALTKANEALRAELDTLKNSLTEQNSQKTKAQVEGLTGEVNTLKSKLEASEQKVKASTEEATSLKTQVEEANKKAEAATAELAKVQAEKTKSVRVATIMAALGEDEAAATATVEKLKYLNDEDFKAHADYMSQKMAAFKQAGTSGKTGSNGDVKGGKNTSLPAPKLPPKQTNKPAPMAGHPKKVKTLAAESDDADVNADPQHLEDVETDNEPALATETTDDGVEKVRASIDQYMSNVFGLPEEAAEETK